MPDGGLTTLDNRRLVAARQTGTPVHANVPAYESPFPPGRVPEGPSNLRDSQGNLPDTYGQAVHNRIAGQGTGFREAHPQGSPIMPRLYGEPVPPAGGGGG